MKKLLALLLVPIFLTPTIIVSTDLESDFEPSDVIDISNRVAEQLTYYTALPTNPVLLKDTVVYDDADLQVEKHVIGQDSTIQPVSLHLNSQGFPVFKLKTGNFILASRQLIYDDLVIEEMPVDLELWTLEGIETFESPLVKGVSHSTKKVAPFSKVRLVKKALTKAGYYFQVEGYGWVSEDFLSSKDQRMAKVQKLLSDKYNKDNLSIYVKSLVTEDIAEINADKIIYTASIAKLPTLYYAQKQLDDGKYRLNQPLKYTEAVIDFEGAFDTGGSGSFSKTADNKEYSVEQVLKAIAKESDNAASNIAGYYLADGFDKAFYREMHTIVGQRWDMVNREATAKMAGQLMEAIYYQNGTIISYLSETDFDDQRISKDIPEPVAHKIGDAYDFRHDVAIVYTTEPFILAILTENMSYDDISAIANEIYSILK